MKTIKSTFALLKNSTDAKRILINLSILGLLLLSLFFLGSCSSDDELPDVKILGGAELGQATLNNREEAMQSFTLVNENGAVITGEQGTTLTFYSNSIVDLNGDPVTGDISIELIEIYDKASMVMNKMPTNGRRDNGDIETLKSAGEFYINATQNGVQLKPASGFQIFAPNDEFDAGMILFAGADNDCDGDGLNDGIECDVVWEEDKRGEVWQGQGDGAGGNGVGGYGGFISNFGWTNIDRWYSDPRPKTILYADVPEGYDDTNCNVYISYDGEPTALALLDIYDAGTGLFSEHYGLIPIGMEVHFIFVSVQNDEYVYAIQGATIGEDHVEIIGATSTGTEAELIALINALP
jgi:hypothetical protein